MRMRASPDPRCLLRVRSTWERGVSVPRSGDEIITPSTDAAVITVLCCILIAYERVQLNSPAECLPSAYVLCTDTARK